MAEQLGQAELLLTVNLSAFEQGLSTARGLVESSLRGAGDNAFKGVERSARESGEKAGKALAEGVKKTTKELKFLSFDQALSFDPKNSIKGLEEYVRALRKLRDTTDLSVSGTQQLNDRIGAVEGALRRAKQTTAEATAEQLKLNAALDKAAYGRLVENSRAFAANLRDQAREAAAAAKQFEAFRKQAEGVAKAVAGIAAKGLGEAVKLPIFGLPKDATGTIDKARAQIERLQKQAETASGKVARLTEGVAALGAGGIAAKGIVDTLGGIGNSAQGVTGILNEVREALASLPGPLKGLGGLDDIFANGAQAIQQWASGILQAQGDLATLAGPLQVVTDALSALGPEAAAVGGALAFTFAGFQDIIAKSFKPGVDGAREALKGMTDDTQRLLEALARVSEASSGITSLRDLEVARADATQRVQANPAGTEANVEATRELLAINKRIAEEKQRQFYQEQQILRTEQERAAIAKRLQDAAKTSSTLALPSSELLNADGRGIRRLNSSEINRSYEEQADALRKQDEAEKKLAASRSRARNDQIALNSALEAGLQVTRTLVGVIDEQVQGYKFQKEQLQEQLNLQNQLRAVEEQRSKAARVRNQEAVNNSPERQRARQEQDLLAVQNKRRAQEQKDRNRRRSEAISNAVIGGAFPLLFGQGIGASIGGGAGGFLGGLKGGQFGFGASLVGTAVGTAFDTAIANVNALGQALSSPIAAFSKLSESALISTKALESQIGALIDTGRQAEAAALIQKDLAQKFGSLDSAQKLATQTDVLNRTWANLTTRLAQFVAGPAAAFIALLNRALGGAPGGADQKGQPTGISFGSFRQQVDQISKERGRDVAADLVRRQIAERDRILKESIRTGKNITLGAADEQAAKRVLDQAAAEGIITKEQAKQNTQLQKAVALREDLTKLSYTLIAADAQGNKVLSDAVKLTSSYKKEQLDLLALTEQERRGPKGQQVREQAAKERQQIREAAKAAAETSTRELKNAKELVGQYGNQRQILEEQQKIAEAKRKADQADAAASNNRFTDPANIAALENARLAAANNYNRVRIEGEQKIRELQGQNFADQIASLNRLAGLQDQINIANERSKGRLTSAGIGALETVAGFNAAKRAEQDIQAQLRARPADQGLQYAAKEAAKQTELAAAKARADLIEASKAAELSVRNIAQSLQDAVLAQQQLTGTNQGLTGILGGQAAVNRQKEVNAQLQADVRATKEEYIRGLGPNADPAVVNAINRKEFGGTLADQNRQMIQFIEAARQELRGAQGINDLQQQLVRAQNDLVTINGKLYEINKELSGSLQNLAEKNWTVNVNVPGGSASGDVVSAVNSRS